MAKLTVLATPKYSLELSQEELNYLAGVMQRTDAAGTSFYELDLGLFSSIEDYATDVVSFKGDEFFVPEEYDED